MRRTRENIGPPTGYVGHYPNIKTDQRIEAIENGALKGELYRRMSDYSLPFEERREAAKELFSMGVAVDKSNWKL